MFIYAIAIQFEYGYVQQCYENPPFSKRHRNL